MHSYHSGPNVVTAVCFQGTTKPSIIWWRNLKNTTGLLWCGAFSPQSSYTARNFVKHSEVGDNAFLIAGTLYIYYVPNQSKKIFSRWTWRRRGHCLTNAEPTVPKAQPIFPNRTLNQNRSHPFPIISPQTTSAYNQPLTSTTCWGKLRRTLSRMHWNFAFSLHKLTE